MKLSCLGEQIAAKPIQTVTHYIRRLFLVYYSVESAQTNFAAQTLLHTIYAKTKSASP